ncbi:MAG: hypothetical protein ABGY08_02655 [Gammaproteobacteria bacterium]
MLKDSNIKLTGQGIQIVSVKAHTVGEFLLWIAIVLTLVHIACMVAWYENLLPIDDWLYLSFFDLDEEESLGTWFSAIILLIAGLLSLFQAGYAITRIRHWHFFWWLLGVGFCLLSLDEVVAFHEFVNTIVEDTHWTTFGAVLVVAVGFVFLPFILVLPLRTRLLFLVSGVLYVGGAIGVEWATIWYEDNDLLDTLAYNLWNALEEFLEMTGVILYIYALLAYITGDRQSATLHLRFGGIP